MANIRGFKDVSKDEKGSDDEGKDKKNTYYAGGAGQGGSGVNVVGPNDGKKAANAADLVSSVFDAAKNHGAVAKHEEEAPEKRKFGGAGTALNGAKVEAEPEPEGIPRVVLTFYSDAFTIDDGAPRAYTDAANQAFLDDINKGRVPREIQNQFGDDVDVELIDKKTEAWKEKPKVFKAFQTGGHSLAAPSSSSGGKKVAPRLLTLDPAAPSTSIRVTLHDGSKVVVKLNVTHTVGDLRAHIEALKPSGKVFELRTMMPPATLDNDAISVKDAGLVNAALVQRLL